MPGSSYASCPSTDALVYAFLAAFEATALFNITELVIKIYLTFQHRSGIYFWALVIAASGTAVNAIGLMLKFFVDESPWVFYSLLSSLGWSAMVTGHSVVLWSRLHLLLPHKYILRGVLAMIAINALCLHTPTAVLFIGYCSPNGSLWESKFAIVDKVQQTLFVVQEIIISALYIRSCLRLIPGSTSNHSRRVMQQILTVNLIVVALNMILLSLGFTSHWEIQVNMRVFIYSLKLRLEFIVLNKLMVLCSSTSTNLTGSSPRAPRGGSLGILDGVDGINAGSGGNAIFKITDFEQEVSSSSSKPSLSLWGGESSGGSGLNSNSNSNRNLDGRLLSVAEEEKEKNRSVSSVDPLAVVGAGVGAGVGERHKQKPCTKGLQHLSLLSRIRHR